LRYRSWVPIVLTIAMLILSDLHLTYGLRYEAV